jgi:hypothetical protein
MGPIDVLVVAQVRRAVRHGKHARIRACATSEIEGLGTAELKGVTSQKVRSRYHTAFYHFTPNNSTSNINVAFGGMTPPAPRAP